MRYSSRRKASISKPHRSKRLRALVGAQDAQHDLARTALPGLLDRGLDETSTHPTALVVRVDGETGDLQDVRPGRREVRQPEEADEPALDITRLGDEHVARAGAVAEEVVAGVAQGRRDGRAARGPRRQVDPPSTTESSTWALRTVITRGLVPVSGRSVGGASITTSSPPPSGSARATWRR